MQFQEAVRKKLWLTDELTKDLRETFGEDDDSVILSKIENKEGIIQSIKDFLGKGK